MARHIAQLRLSANGPSIIKGQALADATLCLCAHIYLYIFLIINSRSY